MIELECGIKAFDAHELLCYLVASRQGYFDDEGLRIRLRDHTFTPNEKLPQRDFFQVACVSAFLARRQGLPFKVLFVGVIRPMFWMHAAADVERIEDLAGARVATYPAFAPPHYLHRLVLRRQGLDPDLDVRLEGARDDQARLGLLRTGDVRAAAVSSAVSPVTIRRRGLQTLACFGDHVTMATSGVAADERVLAERPEAMAGVVRAFRRALEDVHTRADRVVPVLAELLDEPDDIAADTHTVIRPCFTRDGRAPFEELQAAIDVVGQELPGDGAVDASRLYDFSLLDGAEPDI